MISSFPQAQAGVRNPQVEETLVFPARGCITHDPRTRVPVPEIPIFDFLTVLEPRALECAVPRRSCGDSTCWSMTATSFVVLTRFSVATHAESMREQRHARSGADSFGRRCPFWGLGTNSVAIFVQYFKS